ncbi:saccharopine dehydrogenase family protein [Caryophanon latum]|uniref:Saccharopine dehydrogenase n=1 Tax=Caryophanon latum TaxID=33977 RepID=A0A1C0Z4V4_9BACL|nr:saccharopine dehydrogenase C-terminal domain-containing protein [Caryophanon latum]OCS94270.1 saccharopine dehydrogenase [Caryophanon latum]
MKVVVLGAGLMGREIARDLVNSDSITSVILADKKLIEPQLIEQLQSPKIETVVMDANDEQQLEEVMAKGQAVVNALFYKFNEQVAKTAVKVGVHLVDLGGHIDGVTDRVLQLNDAAKQKDVIIIPDMGIAPGMTNVLVGYGASKLDAVESVKLYVGGIPVEPKPPLQYTHVFSLEGMFDHYTKPTLVVELGEEQLKPSLSGMEQIYFDRFGILEAFYTAGGISTLHRSFPGVQTLEYKTIRYEGHAEKFKLLAALGFLDTDQRVKVGDTYVNVRDVTREVMKEKLAQGDEADVVLMRIVVMGEKSEQQVTYEYELMLKKEEGSPASAMARVTGATASAVVQMVIDGTILERGVRPPEFAVPGAKYIQEMAKRGIDIRETEHKSSMIVKW